MVGACGEERGARSDQRSARSEERGARSEEREARSEEREARSEGGSAISDQRFRKALIGRRMYGAARRVGVWEYRSVGVGVVGRWPLAVGRWPLEPNVTARSVFGRPLWAGGWGACRRDTANSMGETNFDSFLDSDAEIPGRGGKTCSSRDGEFVLPKRFASLLRFKSDN